MQSFMKQIILAQMKTGKKKKEKRQTVPNWEKMSKSLENESQIYLS